jgi:AcrR family transcriptional regulator
MNQAAKKPSARTLATRARIIATAEQLFAENGVASVSLNEITRASGQKNRNAVHYHFGNKEALVRAIFEKHWQPIAAMRNRMLADIARTPEPGLDAIARALVLPVAARFDDPDGGLAYIKISAQLAANNLLSFFRASGDIRTSGDGEPAWGSDMSAFWQPYLAPLPPPVRDQRMSLIVGMLFHGLADHAVFRERGNAQLANTELMLSNLVDSICAVLQAPVSSATMSTIEAGASPEPGEAPPP